MPARSQRPPGRDAGPPGRDARTIRSIICAAAAEVGRQFAQADEAPTEDVLLDRVATTLADAPWPGADYRVRRDRPPRRARDRGAWRFDLFVERPDRFMAAIEVRSGRHDLERQVMALSHLTMARRRGIAETAFLVAAEPLERPRGAGLPESPAGPHDLAAGSELAPIAQAEVDLSDGSRWRVRVFEVDPAESP